MDKPKKKETTKFLWLRALFCLGNCQDQDELIAHSRDSQINQNQMLLGQLQYNSLGSDQNRLSMRRKNTNRSCRTPPLLEEKNISSTNHALSKNIVFHLNKNSSIFYLLQNTVKKFITGMDSSTNQLSQDQNSLICKYITQKSTSFTSVLDVFANLGEYSIEFSKVCDFVIAMTNQKQIDQITKEIKLSRCFNNIDIILTIQQTQNFNKFNSDLIFVNLLNSAPESVFAQVLKISRNIIILVSPEFDIQMFTNPLSQYAQTNADQINSIGIQIEDIYFNDKLTCKVIYYGAVCTFDHDSQINILGANIIVDGASLKYGNMSQAINTILETAYFRLGTLHLNQLILQCKQQMPSKGKIIDIFLDTLVNQDIMSGEEIQAIQNDFERKTSKQSFQSYKTRIYCNLCHFKVCCCNQNQDNTMDVTFGDVSQMNYPYESFVKDIYSDTSSQYVGQVYSDEALKKINQNSDNCRSEYLKQVPILKETTRSFFELTH